MITNCIFGIFASNEVLNEKEFKVIPHKMAYTRITEGGNDLSNLKFDNNPTGIKKITWNEKRLNLSILIRSTATVTLDERAEGFGLDQAFSTGMWRNFSILKNGELHVKRLPVVLSSDMISTFSQVPGLITELTEEGECVLDLEVLPIISSEFVQEHVNLNGIQLAEMALMEALCKAQSKCLKHYIKKLSSDQQLTESKYTEDQEKYLSEFFITESGEYSPKKEKSDKIDETVYREFVIKVDGFSSLSKIDDVEKKMRAEKKLNAGDTEISKEILHFNRLRTEMTDGELVLHLQDRLFRAREVSEGINLELQKAKFAVMVNGSEISGLDENKSITCNGIKVTFNF